ncbi:Serine/threonine-protein kinase rio2 [Elasticomyces elasticus]|nr:Serine/threonine-protein kinase rio2 [Elasticomyces elasticus]
MKLDTRAIRYLTAEDWRVLVALQQCSAGGESLSDADSELAQVEVGSKNHEIVPTPLITQLSGLRGGSGVDKSISSLAKVGLIAKVKNATYDGYRLTYGGLDYLALNTYRKQSSVYSVGNQIGVGKESDIYVVADPNGTQRVLKIHRLGRISFRTVKTNRDYLRNRSSASWMYLSRLAAMKEFAFMRVLKDNGFSVPEPIAQSRHTLVMELIDAFPLRQIASIPDPALLYAELVEMIISLARHGLIHGDFNEFNILVRETRERTRTPTPTASRSRVRTPSPSLNSNPAPKSDPSPSDSALAPLSESQDVTEQFSEGDQAPINSTSSPNPNPSTQSQNVRLIPVLIDFPQMLSISHPDAQSYFDRDVSCIKRFFQRRFGFTSDTPGPFFADAVEPRQLVKRLDVEVQASGFSKKIVKELEAHLAASRLEPEDMEHPASQDEADDASSSSETSLDDDADDSPIYPEIAYLAATTHKDLTEAPPKMNEREDAQSEIIGAMRELDTSPDHKASSPPTGSTPIKAYGDKTTHGIAQSRTREQDKGKRAGSGKKAAAGWAI